MIIDCHGHYTTAPAQLQALPRRPAGRLADLAPAARAPISDDELRESVEANQLRDPARARRRPDDLLAEGVGHGAPRARPGDAPSPGRGRATTSSPASPSSTPSTSPGSASCRRPPGGIAGRRRRRAAPLRRASWASSARNLNPDPSGGFWTSPPLTDPYWFPVYEALRRARRARRWCTCRARATRTSTRSARTTSTPTPRRSCSCSRATCSSGSRRCAWSSRTAAARCPYHWGRYRGLAMRMGRPDPSDAAAQRLLRHLRLPPARHRPADPRDPDGEHPVRLRDARRRARRRPGDRHRLGRHQDLPRRGRTSTTTQRHAVFEGNARRVYPRLDARLRSRDADVPGCSSTFACGDYDRTRALEEGTVRADGIDLTYLRLPVEETFFRMLRHREFEVAEMSLSSYVEVPATSTSRRSWRCRSTRPGSSGTAGSSCTPTPASSSPRTCAARSSARRSGS